MKYKIIVVSIILLFGFVNFVDATTYYIDASSGSDTRTGLSINNAWKTLSKAQSNVSSGDTILLKRGEVWRESFTVPVNNLQINAYGEGTKPVISGADVISGSWSFDNGNIYSIPLSGTVYQIFDNGEWIHLSHEPDGNTVYFTDEASLYPKDTRFEVPETGDDMKYSVSNLSGASLVGRTAQWDKDVYKVDYYNPNTNTIYLINDGKLENSATKFNYDYWPKPNQYWLTDKKVFLDTEEEWYHDASSNKLYVYQKNGGKPSGTWEAISRKNAIYAKTKDNLSISNIEIKNSVNGMYLLDCLNFSIDSVNFNDIGTQKYQPGFDSKYVSMGIYMEGKSDRAGEVGTIENSTFNNILRNGILGRDYSSVIIENNSVSNIGTIGENVSMPILGAGTAIQAQWGSSNWIVRSNTVDNIGYNGIEASVNMLIEDNIILDTMMYMGDGGAIYAGGYAPIIARNNYINIVGLKVGEGGYGNTKVGIYLDEDNSNCVVEDNIIIETGRCLYNHFGSNNHFNNNICLDYATYGFYSNNYADPARGGAIKSMEFNGNIMSTEKDSFIYHVYFSSRIDGEIPHTNWFDSLSDIDYNTYYPDRSSSFLEKYNSRAYYHDFTTWRSATKFDAHSSISKYDGSGNSDYCDVTPTIVPSKTNISYPTNNATTISTNPTIRYNEYTDSRNDPQNCFSYNKTHIQIDEQGENWSTPVYENTNAGNTTQEVTGLSNNTQYQVRVRHKNNRSGSINEYYGDWSDTVSFTTQIGSTSIRADVDQQNGINSTDAMLTLRNSLSLDMSQTAWQESATTGDANCDGTSNSTDAMLILRHSVGLSMSGTGWCE